MRWLRQRHTQVRRLIPIGLWILFVELTWGQPIFNNEAFNKENDVEPSVFLSSLFCLFVRLAKKWFLECISSAVIVGMWNIKRLPQNIEMTAGLAMSKTLHLHQPRTESTFTVMTWNYHVIKMWDKCTV